VSLERGRKESSTKIKRALYCSDKKGIIKTHLIHKCISNI
jgi:hypothetical protein